MTFYEGHGKYRYLLRNKEYGENMLRGLVCSLYVCSLYVLKIDVFPIGHLDIYIETECNILFGKESNYYFDAIEGRSL